MNDAGVVHPFIMTTTTPYFSAQDALVHYSLNIMTIFRIQQDGIA